MKLNTLLKGIHVPGGVAYRLGAPADVGFHSPHPSHEREGFCFWGAPSQARAGWRESSCAGGAVRCWLSLKEGGGPDQFEESTFAECSVFLLADNLDGDADALAPLDWWNRIERVSEKVAMER